MEIKVLSTVPAFDPSIDASMIDIPLSVVNEDAQEGETTNFDDQFRDVISSGGFGDLDDSEWRVETLTKLFTSLTPEQKIAVFIKTLEGMPDADGWSLNDIHYLKELCGVESFEATFNG